MLIDVLAWIKALKKEVLDQTLELCDRLVDVTVPAAAVRSVMMIIIMLSTDPKVD